MNDSPSLAGYILWLALILGLLMLADHYGVADEARRDPAEGTHIPSYIHGR